jgi:hypothetical protein
MVAIGDQLLQPEEGWTRYDEKDYRLAFSGNWTTYTFGSNNQYYYDNSHKYTTDTTSTLKIKFRGKRIRMIAQTTHVRSNNIRVVVDGIQEDPIDQYREASTYMAVVYERQFDEVGEHTIVFTNMQEGAEFAVDAIDLGSDDLLYAPDRAIGSILKTPDPGWQRIDDADKRIAYRGSWNTYTNTSYSGGTMHETRVTGSTVDFSFLGDRFRIISFGDLAGYRTTDVRISVDGQPAEMYSEVSKRGDYGLLAYQKEDLEYGYHTVRITSGTVSAYKMYLDAIDINDNGKFYSPLPATTGTLRSKVSEMEIGDYILVNTWISPSLKMFSLGQEDVIFGAGNENYFNSIDPVLGLTSTAPRGHFYFIKVDKGVLVADRNILKASWDVIYQRNDGNNGKMDLIDGTSIDKGPVLPGYEGDFANLRDALIRSLSGGIAYRDAYDNISASNGKYGAYPSLNEWDRYIRNFPVSSIKPGYSLDDVFHCVRDGREAPLYTLCRETPYLTVPNVNGTAATASDRTMRTGWMNGDSGFSHLASSNGDYSAFRPVLEYNE